jgi:hypothetical protein
MEKNCDTCAYKGMESEDADGNRIVDCDINDLQIFSPWADECKHWEKALSEDDED